MGLPTVTRLRSPSYMKRYPAAPWRRRSVRRADQGPDLQTAATDLGESWSGLYLRAFGMLNALAAAEAMEGNHYFTGKPEIITGTASFYGCPGVPAGTQQVKILLYWARRSCNLSSAGERPGQ